MAFVLKDRVKETTTSTGTGTVTLAGAATGYQSFSAIGNANTTYYCIAGQGTSEWEVGIGTYTSSGTTLARTTVLASSNSGSLVNFSAGTKDVFCTFPASEGTPSLNYSIYTSGTSTWTAPNGVVSAKATVIGGGGASAEDLGSGGNGGIAVGVYTVNPGTGYTVTVGAGGATNNASGGTSSFSSFCSATGGSGGASGANGSGSSGNYFNSNTAAGRSVLTGTSYGAGGADVVGSFNVGTAGVVLLEFVQ